MAKRYVADMDIDDLQILRRTRAQIEALYNGPYQLDFEEATEIYLKEVEFRARIMEKYGLHDELGNDMDMSWDVDEVSGKIFLIDY